jgi:hypothetical protein
MAYVNLEVARRYLKSIDALATDPTKGITQEDLTQAELDAQARIDSDLASYYDTSGWAEDTPPIIETVAELLASAQVLRYRYQRDSLGGTESAQFAELLRSEGERLLAEVKAGRLSVVGTRGGVQRMRPGVGSTVPRARNPKE